MSGGHTCSAHWPRHAAESPLGLESHAWRGVEAESKRLTSALGALWLIWSALPHPPGGGGRASRLSDKN